MIQPAPPASRCFTYRHYPHGGQRHVATHGTTRTDDAEAMPARPRRLAWRTAESCDDTDTSGERITKHSPCAPIAAGGPHARPRETAWALHPGTDAEEEVTTRTERDKRETPEEHQDSGSMQTEQNTHMPSCRGRSTHTSARNHVAPAAGQRGSRRSDDAN